LERGDALRNVIDHSGTPVVRLAEVLRQRDEADRRFSRLLASGDVAEAFAFADRRGLIRETLDDERCLRARPNTTQETERKDRDFGRDSLLGRKSSGSNRTFARLFGALAS